MTDPGHVGSAGVAPPPFTCSSLGGTFQGCAAASGGRCRAFLCPRRALDVEAPGFRHPRDPLAEVVRRRLQRPGELDDRRQARLTPGPLQERDLGPVQVAEVAQLFLRDASGGAGLPQLDCETLLGGHRGILFGCGQKLYRRYSSPGTARCWFRYLAGRDLPGGPWDVYAVCVEQCSTMCYTRATNWTSAEASAAKEEL